MVPQVLAREVLAGCLWMLNYVHELIWLIQEDATSLLLGSSRVANCVLSGSYVDPTSCYRRSGCYYVVAHVLQISIQDCDGMQQLQS